MISTVTGFARANLLYKGLEPEFNSTREAVLIRTFHKDLEYKNISPIIPAVSDPESLKKMVRDLNNILYPHEGRSMKKFAYYAKEQMDKIRGKTLNIKPKK